MKKILTLSLGLLITSCALFGQFTPPPSGPQAITTDVTGKVISHATVDFSDVSMTLPSSVTLDSEWDTAAKINAATTDDDFVTLTGTQTITGNKVFDSEIKIFESDTNGYSQLILGNAGQPETSMKIFVNNDLVPETFGVEFSLATGELSYLVLNNYNLSWAKPGGPGGTGYMFRILNNTDDLYLYQDLVVLEDPDSSYDVSISYPTLTGNTAINIPDNSTINLATDGTGTFAPIASSATITGSWTFSADIDMNGNDIVLDPDADTTISASADDSIVIKVNNSTAATLTSSGANSLTITAGNGLTVEGKLSISGDKLITSYTTTLGDATPVDNLDVSTSNIVYAQPSIQNIIIGGFTGGSDGQVIHVAVIQDTAYTVTLEHNEGTANQNIFLNTGADETISSYGGWTLVYDSLLGGWIEIDN